MPAVTLTFWIIKILATTLGAALQEFWLQGYVPLQRLYWYREYGYAPEGDTRTGAIDSLAFWRLRCEEIEPCVLDKKRKTETALVCLIALAALTTKGAFK